MARVRLAVAATAVLALGLSACGSPSSSNDKDTKGGDTGKINTAVQGIDRNAKGPAPEVAGAHKGGTITVYSQSTPNTLDPTNIYYTDSNEIAKLLFRTPTQYAIREGKPVLVPDLTDLGTNSADGLTWTFKLQPNIKYADGTPIAIDDMAYAIKRSFAHDVFDAGPTYQLTYFKDGSTYKGPYKSGDTFGGVETQGTDTLIIHLSKKFPDLPYFMTFPMFTPIPKAKDKKQDYQNNPMTTGPYMFDVFTPGRQHRRLASRVPGRLGLQVGSGRRQDPAAGPELERPGRQRDQLRGHRQFAGAAGAGWQAEPAGAGPEPVQRRLAARHPQDPGHQRP
jgi:peptide/nickel transport system substrate-binding protein